MEQYLCIFSEESMVLATSINKYFDTYGLWKRQLTLNRDKLTKEEYSKCLDK